MLNLTPIERLNLRPRAYSYLVNNGIDFAEHLALYTYDDLLQLPGVGKVTAEDIKLSMTANGLSLAGTLGNLHPRERHRHEFEARYGKDYPELFKR
jgi:DNA-directed RNA polymerase alpha subunit